MSLLGCHDTLPIEYETEHLRIGTDLDAPLCEGDLVALEQTIARAEDELGFTLDRTYTVYVWDDFKWWDGPNEACRPSDRAAGCTSREDATIWTAQEKLEHELVHAVVDVRAHPFFDESVADGYGGYSTQFGRSAPSANADSDWATMDHVTGAHFVRWLRERWGAHRLGRLLRAGEDSFAAFETVYGMTVEEAEQLYFAEAPYAYAPLGDCQAPDLAPAPLVDGWIDRVDFDCIAGHDTRTAGAGMLVHRSVHIPVAGYYAVTTDGDWLDLRRCAERFDDPPAPLGWTADVPDSHATYPSQAYAHYEGGTVHELYFAAGDHDVSVGLLGYDQGSVHVAIWPSLAAHPLEDTP